jgi:hypothetical protein
MSASIGLLGYLFTPGVTHAPASESVSPPSRVRGQDARAPRRHVNTSLLGPGLTGRDARERCARLAARGNDEGDQTAPHRLLLDGQLPGPRPIAAATVPQHTIGEL